MTHQRPKRESMSIEERPSPTWEIAEAQQLALKYTPKGNARWLTSLPPKRLTRSENWR